MSILFDRIFRESERSRAMKESLNHCFKTRLQSTRRLGEAKESETTCDDIIGLMTDMRISDCIAECKERLANSDLLSSLNNLLTLHKDKVLHAEYAMDDEAVFCQFAFKLK